MDRDAGRGGGERRAARAGEPTLVHVNGIYIKAAQISSWVLNVRGSKKPFRHAASPLIVKIDGALVLCSCRLRRRGRGRWQTHVVTISGLWKSQHTLDLSGV